MKKALSLFLATIACLSVGMAFTACGESNEASSPEASTPIESTPAQSSPTQSEPESSTPTEEEVFTGITEEEWNAAIAPISFENYTMVADGYVKQNDGTEMQQYNVIKMTENRMTVDMTATLYKKLGVTLETPEVMNVLFDFYENPDEFEAQKNAQEQVFLALLADYKNYQWNAEKQAYVCTQPFTVEIYMAVYDTSVSILMTNGSLYLTNNGKVDKFVCDYTQTMVMPGETMVVDTNFTWTFSDYGTTVIE